MPWVEHTYLKIQDRFSEEKKEGRDVNMYEIIRDGQFKPVG